MNVTLWGTRGSVASPGPDTVRYGGNTSCVELRGSGGTLIVLDAGTGIRNLGASLDSDARRINLLLSHFHMDHIQGLGFFAPLFRQGVEVHVWGPASTTQRLEERLARYLSPPLFPVRLRDLHSTLIAHELGTAPFSIGEFVVTAALVSHPGPTVGYRITDGRRTITYLPDHEPALGWPTFPYAPDWTSGYGLAADADLLIHDAQYTDEEYSQHVGWGHSALSHTFAFAKATGAKRVVTFHHDPTHTDAVLDRLIREASHAHSMGLETHRGMEGTTLEI